MSDRNLSGFINFLGKRLQEELPGEAAQRHMAPLRPGQDERGFFIPPGARQSAVLLLLIVHPLVPVQVLFTLRSGKLNSHKGQISFPGGRCDEGESYEETAIREAWEEVGLAPEKVQLLGQLSQLYVYPSNSAITPVVGYIQDGEVFSPNESEVDEIFTLPLETFLREEILKRESWKLGGQDVEVPYWNVHATTPLWGATAIILNELLFLYREFLEQNSGPGSRENL